MCQQGYHDTNSELLLCSLMLCTVYVANIHVNGMQFTVCWNAIKTAESLFIGILWFTLKTQAQTGHTCCWREISCCTLPACCIGQACWPYESTATSEKPIRIKTHQRNKLIIKLVSHARRVCRTCCLIFALFCLPTDPYAPGWHNFPLQAEAPVETGRHLVETQEPVPMSRCINIPRDPEYIPEGHRVQELAPAARTRLRD